MPKNELQNLLEASETFTEVLAAFGLRNVGSNYRTLVARLRHEEIDYSRFRENKKRGGFRRKGKGIALTDILVEYSSYSRYSLKKRIIDNNLIPYICGECGQNNEWLGKKLVLVMDHRNGIHNDNRIENLRFLCPNCNSQTPTFAGRNKKYIPGCGKGSASSL